MAGDDKATPVKDFDPDEFMKSRGGAATATAEFDPDEFMKGRTGAEETTFPVLPASTSATKKPGYFKRLGQSIGAPTSAKELGEAVTPTPLKLLRTPTNPEEAKEYMRNAASVATGGAYPLLEGAYNWGKKAIGNIGEGIGEEYQAAKNIAAGQPVLPNLGKAGYGIVHGGVGSIPFVGEPIETAGEDVLNKNYAGAAGGLTGVIGQVAAPELLDRTKPLATAVKESIPTSKADLAMRLRDEATGKITPGVEGLSRLLGASIGHLANYIGVPTVGELGGYAVGPKLADMVIPKIPFDRPLKTPVGASLPDVGDFYQQRAEDLTARGKEQAKLDKANAERLKEEEDARQKELADQEKLKQQHAESLMQRQKEQDALDKANAHPLRGMTSTAGQGPGSPTPLGSPLIPPIGPVGPAPTRIGGKVEVPGITAPIGPTAKAAPTKIISPTEGEAVRTGNEGRPATWTNEYILQEAAKGNREAIRQGVLRGLTLPENVRYVMGDPDTARAVLNPREVTRFTPEGEPIRDKSNPFTTEPTARIPTIGRTPKVVPPVSVIPKAPATEAIPFQGPLDVNAPTKPIMEGAPTIPDIGKVTPTVTPEAEQAASLREIKPKLDKTAKKKIQPVAERLSHEDIANAEGLLASEAGAMATGDRPGVYYDESEQGDVRLGSRGAQTRGGDWRGVKSGRRMYPFMRENPDVNPQAVLKALRNKDSAAYNKFITRADDFLKGNYAKGPGMAAMDFLKALENPDAEPETIEAGADEFTPPEETPKLEPSRGLMPEIGKGQTGIIPGMEENVAKQREGAAKVSGENLTAEANKPKDISAAAGRMETLSPLFRGTEASPQREIFGNAPPAANEPPATIAPVIKEAGWDYEGRNALGQYTIRMPGTDVRIHLFERQLEPEFIRRQILAKEKQYGTPKEKGGKGAVNF